MEYVRSFIHSFVVVNLPFNREPVHTIQSYVHPESSRLPPCHGQDIEWAHPSHRSFLEYNKADLLVFTVNRLYNDFTVSARFIYKKRESLYGRLAAATYLFKAFVHIILDKTLLVIPFGRLHRNSDTKFLFLNPLLVLESNQMGHLS